MILSGFFNSKNTRRISFVTRIKFHRLVQDSANYKVMIDRKRFCESWLHHVFEFLKSFVWVLVIENWNLFRRGGVLIYVY
ncbi:hypothetical protein A3I53_01690 [Candidatus Curtissbacteria bacterium RIFCSPLOWO2_02_FULL_40_13b]|uniref:Uncharacterized protein n=2 Tax=Candidatus Curtissiibacteriota TaxID=1752717 RepID=A0A1F5HXX9_9BACT|nr:MAG: hypothetical protein A2693_04875 [Candidatus Curtissbacteria bacterium RIFCSPHIGHO2_01_FULL_40_12]OGE08835.1 MAG: hypothetical protein A3I53_01690 [Candidatus Curtissbacteria bacterium RIFCSPLOWO2_02_FULL_40_13b]